MAEKKLYLEDVDQRLLFGYHNTNLAIIEAEFPVEITARSDWVYLKGSEDVIETVEKVLKDITDHLKATGELSDRYIHYAITMVKENGTGPNEQILDVEPLVLSLTTHQAIKPRTIGQNPLGASSRTARIPGCN